MKFFKRALFVLAGLILIAGIVAFFYARRIAAKGLPDYSADVRLAGMKDEAVVYRDAYAVPHIYAKSDEDLYRVTGYVMAQDRLWQMDLIRRATAGRLAEIFGAKLIDADLFMRMLRIPEKSARAVAKTEPAMALDLEAFADGVNQFIEAHRKSLPLEFSLLGYEPEPWRPEHSLNLIGYMGWMGADTIAEDRFIEQAGQKLGSDSEKFKELLPDPALFKTVINPGFKVGPGAASAFSLAAECRRALSALGLKISLASNNWAVSGERSATGKPLLANDMHLDYGLPGIWYQIHQSVEGSLDVTGVTLPGSPFVVAGHNRKIAWGYTFVTQDALDLYRETIDPDNPKAYRFNGESRPLEVRPEVIKIKGGGAVTKDIYSTHRGPLISGGRDFGPGAAVSMRWVGLDDSNESRATYQMNRAGNWDEFKEGLKEFTAIGVNTVYADVEGNIGIYTCAGIPIRKKGDGLGVMPGDTDAFDWTGLVPFDALPHSFNPPGGAVFSANNKPAEDGYPYPLGHYFTRERVERIRERLEEKPKFAVADFVSMQGDLKSRRGESFGRAFAAELEKKTDWSALEGSALGLLKSWDAEFRADSPAAAIFEALFARLARGAVEDELGPELTDAFLDSVSHHVVIHLLAHPESPWWDDIRTPDRKETFSDILVRSFSEAVSGLERTWGIDPQRWAWGKMHTLTLRHPMSQIRVLDLIFKLNRGPFPLGGSYDTLPQQAYPMGRDFGIVMGPSQRHVFDTADWNRSLTVLPAGEAGVPASLFYGDQTALFLGNRYHADPFSRDLVEKAARFRMRVLKSE